RYWIELELEAVILGKRLQQRDRLLAIRGVEMDEADLLALELVETALDVGDVTNESRRAVPIDRIRIEYPGKQIAVGRSGQPVGKGEGRNLVDAGLGYQLQRDASGIWVDPGRIFALARVIALDAFLGVVTGLALLDDQLDAADAAIPLVEHV